MSNPINPNSERYTRAGLYLFMLLFGGVAMAYLFTHTVIYWFSTIQEAYGYSAGPIAVTFLPLIIAFAVCFSRLHSFSKSIAYGKK